MPKTSDGFKLECRVLQSMRIKDRAHFNHNVYGLDGNLLYSFLLAKNRRFHPIIDNDVTLRG
jgi:hypothetical protein